MSYNPFIIVEVLESDGETVICEPPRRWDVTGSDPLNLPGVCTLSLLRSDSVFTRHPGLLAMGHWVRYTLCDGLGAEKVVALMHIRNTKTKFVGAGEAGDYIRTVSGPTLHGTLKDFIVKHVTQPPRTDSPESRFFGWASPVDDWYEGADWDDTLTSEGEWRDHITDARSGTTEKPHRKPRHWPDKLAEWIHVDSGAQWQFYRDVITIPVDGKVVRWFLTADEVIRGFIDGDLVISRDEDESGYKSFGEYKVFLPEGDHQLAVMMRKKNTAGGDTIDAWLGTLWTVKTDGSLDTLIKRSNTTWNVHDGLPAPGWKQAEILKVLVNEAKIRGNLSATRLELDFTHLVDTRGDTWGGNYNKTFSIGASILDVQAQLSEMGDFDIYVNPANFKIQAWKRRGSDKSDNIALEAGRNLIDWEVEENDNVGNKALVHYDGGWLMRTNTESVIDYGEREIAISLGSVADDDTAAAIADSHIETRKAARRRAGAAEEWNVDQDKQPVASIIPTRGATPFLDFGTGDSVKAPTHTGVHKKQRLAGLSFNEDNDTALLSFDPDFSEED